MLRLLKSSVFFFAASVIVVWIILQSYAPPRKEGEKVPYHLQLRSMDGSVWALERFKGKPILLNFWATWCPPCMQELPVLALFAKNHPEITVIGIAVSSSREEVNKMVNQFNVTFPIATLANGSTDTWATSLPTTYAIDTHGNIIGSYVSSLSESTLEDIAKKLRP